MGRIARGKYRAGYFLNIRFALDEDLATRIDQFMAEEEIANRSEAIRTLLRMALAADLPSVIYDARIRRAYSDTTSWIRVRFIEWCNETKRLLEESIRLNVRDLIRGFPTEAINESQVRRPENSNGRT